MQMSVPLAKWIILKQRSRRVPGNTERLNRATTSISTRTRSNVDFRILNFGTCTRPRMPEDGAGAALHICNHDTRRDSDIEDRTKGNCVFVEPCGVIVDTCKRKQAWRRRHCRERTIRSSGVWPDLHFIENMLSELRIERRRSSQILSTYGTHTQSRGARPGLL